MAMELIIFLTIFYTLLPSSFPSPPSFNIIDFGANSNSPSTTTEALLAAWSAACRSPRQTIIHVPRGRFHVGHVLFKGPCKSRKITIRIDGTLVAPSHYDNLDDEWIVLERTEHVAIHGGVLDGQGAALWACKASGRGCPYGTTSLRVRNSKDVVITGLTSVNSKLYHIVVDECHSVTLHGVKISAPGSSPNTDGIHVEASSHVSIVQARISTGDDCISIGPGAKHLRIDHVSCGPGHGISIGSLGKEHKEEGVYNVTVTYPVLTSSANGLRIKTWGRRSDGFVRDVRFEHAVMHNVHNPIIITQNYCPHNEGCPHQDSGVHISNVVYSHIRGSSADPVAVQFDCSRSTPCTGIALRDVRLRYNGGEAAARCKHVVGGRSVRSQLVPHGCF